MLCTGGVGGDQITLFDQKGSRHDATYYCDLSMLAGWGVVQEGSTATNMQHCVQSVANSFRLGWNLQASRLQAWVEVQPGSVYALALPG
jgi:hypothetical protein